MWLLLNACNQWLRTHLAWSNSWQSWKERLGTLGVLVGAFALVFWGSRLSVWQQTALWAVLLAVLALMLRRGWLKLFGPVLFYDMVRVGRRSRYFLFRIAYVTLLLLLLWWVYLFGQDDSTSLQAMATFAENLFFMFMIVQLVLTLILTPAYLAGAIAEEKDRKTLEYLLATDLRNREIVLSKLVARLANLLLIVLAGLPVLSFVQFFGGVDPGLLLAGFAATALIMVSLAGVSMLCSVHARKPRDAIVVSYLAVLGYHGIASLTLFLLNTTIAQIALGMFMGVVSAVAAYLLPATPFNLEVLSLLLQSILESDAEVLASAVNGINSGNLIWGLVRLGEATHSNTPGEFAATLLSVLGNFAIFHGLVAVVTSTWAVIRLRRVALKEGTGRTAKLPWTARLFHRPNVGGQPMVWKELFAEPGLRFNWLGRAIIGLLVFLSFVPALFIFYFFISYNLSGPVGSRDSWDELSMSMNMYARLTSPLVACLTWLAVAVRASSSLSGERDRQTMDALLTSPLDTSSILFAKWLGSIASVRWAWAWLGAIWFLPLVLGGVQPAAIPAMIAAWFVYAGCFACVGLWYSLVCSTTLRATMWTLFTTVMLAGGHWLVMLLACYWPAKALSFSGGDTEYIAKFQAGQTPPAVLFILGIHGGMEFRGARSEYLEMIGFAVLGLGTWSVAGLALAVLVHYRFQALAHRLEVRRQALNPFANGAATAPPATSAPDVANIGALADIVPIVIVETSVPAPLPGDHITRAPPPMTDGT
jgi:ABC-type transport system involved in multi-copper enzyme maturation permease subunit